MNLLIAGGRDFRDTEALRNYLYMLGNADMFKHETSVRIVSGMAKGADTCAVEIAKSAGFELMEYPAQWETYGKSAGYRRNTEMAAIADVLVACWDGKSRGTKHMITTMKNLGKPVHILPY